MSIISIIGAGYMGETPDDDQSGQSRRDWPDCVCRVMRLLPDPHGSNGMWPTSSTTMSG
jgi:hypothetical protein